MRSLWLALHDGMLLTCRSDTLARSVELELALDYLFEGEDPPPVRLRLEGVTSARATTFVPWPGAFKVPPGTPRAEESRLVAEYQAKWREESVSWAAFESVIEALGLWIYRAELAQGPGGRALKFEGGADGEDGVHRGFVVHLSFGAMTLLTEDGAPLDLEALIERGERYWHRD